MNHDLDEEVSQKCGSKIKALQTCYARYPKEPERNLICRRLNNTAAMCLVSLICSEEVESVKTYCSSVGTFKKSKQCQIARDNLSICLDAHQLSQSRQL